MSPAIITRVMDYLLFTERRVPMRELVVIHTGEPDVHRGIEDLLNSFPGVQLREIDGVRYFPDARYVSDVHGEARFGFALDGMEACDLIDEESNNRMFASICRQVWRLRRAGYDVTVMGPCRRLWSAAL